MKTFLAAAFLAALPLIAAEDQKPADKKPERPRIEVCFVLDTTGSMSGLIEGAKQKIWGIANDIIAAKPTPEVRFGLIGYRDRSDDYVTKRVELTDDLDAVHAKLKEFHAKGGGDWPESVSEALDEAVQKIAWTKDKSVLKIIYLVGDAPPQEYKDGKDWRKVCEDAVKADLLINTVQCGAAADTTKVWQAIASRGEGAFVALPQDGNMAVIATPHDKELAEWSVKIGDTLIAWGNESQRRGLVAKQSAADLAVGGAAGVTSAPTAAASSVAERASFNVKSGKAVQGEGELLDAIKGGKVTLEKVKKEELPEDLRKLSPDELKAHVEKKQAERDEIQKKIAELSKKRDAFIAAERAKLAKEKKGDSFDTQVAQTLRTQAKKKGIRYE
jgi:Mg-chelatase subunit ChlD